MIFSAIRLTILLTPIGALEAVAINAPLNKNGIFCRFFNFKLFKIKINIGVVIKILPSLLKNRVIKKQSNKVFQNNRIPDPFESFNIKAAVQLKKPKLSSTIAITIVAIIVIAAPVTFELISSKSPIETLPLKKTRMAPTAAGIASFIFLGRIKIKTIVRIKAKMVIVTVD